VRVTKWCEDTNDRRECAELIFGNEDEILDAINSEPWTSTDCFAEPLADAFVKCIEDCGGKAKTIPC
jgi:hypothetical protein